MSPVITLTAAYWIFTAIGVLATFSQCCLTFYILHKYILKSETWHKLEYQLILFRVLLDALNGVSSLTYFLSSIPVVVYSAPFDATFVIGLVGSNLLEMRSFLAAVIAVERVLAATIPLEFYKYRNTVSNYPILAFVLSTAVAADTVLIAVCDFRLPLSPGCANFACSTPPCYQTYSSATKVIYSSTNAVFSAILCYKLCWLSWKRAHVPVDFRRANWLSLTDGLSTLTFDLLPSLVFNSGLVDSRGLGPAMGTLRQMGRAVEAAVMVKLMRNKRVVEVRSSASFRINAL